MYICRMSICERTHTCFFRVLDNTEYFIDDWLLEKILITVSWDAKPS